MNEKAPTRKRRLNLDTRGSDYTSIPATINVSQKDRRACVQLAHKWAYRGYYPSPSKAMQALLVGVR